ncbi:MAG: GatB/YqeY domain-containing protein [Alphaproteobacteria bacterium]|nr:MAG: GatB/YqeY domain-containing protein [Alphaproteobacteria bacterium]
MASKDLRGKIAAELKAAMKNRDETRLATLRLINAALKDREIARRGSGEDNAEGLSDEEVRAILAKMVKQRQESARAYEEGGRLDLAERERAEIGVIEEFLPQPLSEEEIRRAVEEAITATDAHSIRDMGRVMGALKKRYTGQMDFGRVGGMVKERLG